MDIIALMAKIRKQITLNGETFVAGKNRRFYSLDNPAKSISRRQAEKAELQTKGFKSFEEKAKTRKALGVPKGYKQKKLNPRTTRAYYHKTFDTIPELKQALRDLPENTRLWVKAHVVKHYPNITRNQGETAKAFNKRKNLKLIMSITPTGEPDYLLTHVDFAKIKRQLLTRFNYEVQSYEIEFTFIPSK